MPRRPALTVFAILAVPVLLAGCDLFGGESAESVAARREAEGKAIGAACRHAGRAIEDCFGLNKRADKAAVFAGWREMNDYMRDNKVETVVPQGLGGSTAAAEPPAGGPAKVDKADHKPEKADKTEKVEKAEKTEKPEKIEKAEKIDKPAKPKLAES